MMKEKVGYVTEDEKSEIKKLHERKYALNELLPSLGNGLLPQAEYEKLYEKIIEDLGRTRMLSDQWWSKMSQKYQWKSRENGYWNIDFDTNEIFLAC